MVKEFFVCTVPKIDQQTIRWLKSHGWAFLHDPKPDDKLYISAATEFWASRLLLCSSSDKTVLAKSLLASRGCLPEPWLTDRARTITTIAHAVSVLADTAKINREETREKAMLLGTAPGGIDIYMYTAGGWGFRPIGSARHEVIEDRLRLSENCVAIIAAIDQDDSIIAATQIYMWMLFNTKTSPMCIDSLSAFAELVNIEPVIAYLANIAMLSNSPIL